MVEPALVGVGVCAASVLVAVVVGLLLSWGIERLFRVGRRDSPSDEPEATEEPGAPPGEPEAGPEDVPAETEDAPT